MESASFVTLLAQAMTHATQRDGRVRIEKLDGGWETSIVIDRRRVAIARDEYLEATLIRLNAQLKSPSSL